MTLIALTVTMLATALFADTPPGGRVKAFVEGVTAAAAGAIAGAGVVGVIITAALD